jgi:hypothetical protein
MPAQPNKKLKSYMKPPAKRVTIQKPQQKGTMAAPGAGAGSDGFTRISDSTIRKVYK